MLRVQYHFRNSDRGLLAWDVRRLVRLSAGLPVRPLPLSAIAELDEPHWYLHGHVAPTCRSVAEHCALIMNADTTCPVILDQAGRLMDGMHRICKALLQSTTTVPAVRFAVDPEPDYVGREPESLPYD